MERKKSELATDPESIRGMMEEYASFQCQADLAEALKDAEWPERQPRAVRTVAMFYYRAMNGGVEMVMSR